MAVNHKLTSVINGRVIMTSEMPNSSCNSLNTGEAVFAL